MMAPPSPFIAFFFGVLSVLSPCVLPVIPLIAAYSTKSSKFVPITIVIGLSISFAAMGVLASAFGSVFQQYQTILYITGGILIVFLGIYMIFDVIEQKIRALVPDTGTGVIRRLSATSGGGVAGGFVLGFSLGIVWTPCIGPILGAILTMVAVEGDILYGGFLLVIYSLGLGLPLLVIAYTSRFTLKPFIKYSLIIRKVSGIVLVLAGLYFISSYLFLFF
ncbi:MAG: Thiol:disulfide interchange protein DsbD [Candidatus Argoarchaeum ethanivorans]|uniref:Thiol:disulfide interchange protein DsbD n=1 Tax=Candidatus Argoarchaeum ethanivorans TaxID=2608793 RepID=A0A811TF91_9EURY|nr:MAG: Thiol:disulfide interchange protein DsbD [Candidatus Argoarchaeum ethanivorans]